MFKEKQLRNKIIEKIEEIPPESLNEVYKLVSSVKTKKNGKNKLTSYAGIWRDLPKDVFDLFTKKLASRRRRASSRRSL